MLFPLGTLRSGAGQVGEWGQPIFEFSLGVELYRQFGEDDAVVAERSPLGPSFNLPARPFKPFGILREDVRNDAGIDQNHSFPHVDRSYYRMRPFVFPRRTMAA